MKKDNSNNLGHENELYSCEVFRSKTRTTGNRFDITSKQHDESLSFGDDESPYCHPLMTRCHSFPRCASHVSSSELSDDDTVSSSSIHFTTCTKSIPNSLSNDGDKFVENISSSLYCRSSPELHSRRRIRSTSSVSPGIFSNPALPLSLLHMANPIQSCDSIRDCDVHSERYGTNNVVIDNPIHSDQFFQSTGDRHVTQTLDWTDSIYQSSDNAMGGKCKNEKWSNLILLCDPDGIGIHPFI